MKFMMDKISSDDALLVQKDHAGFNHLPVESRSIENKPMQQVAIEQHNLKDMPKPPDPPSSESEDSIKPSRFTQDNKIKLSLVPHGTTAGDSLKNDGSQSPKDRPEKVTLIQRQLVLLLHAHKCQQREIAAESSEKQRTSCIVPYCSTMKDVLRHMITCCNGRTCSYAHCTSSRQIISHWKNCSKDNCLVCQPIKMTQSMSNGTGVFRKRSVSICFDSVLKWILSGMPENAECETDKSNEKSNDTENSEVENLPHPGTLNTTKEWHAEMANNVRDHFVEKLVQTIFPLPNPIDMNDKDICHLFTCARKAEKEMFEMADDREDYYRLLAQKICGIQKEMIGNKKLQRLNAILANKCEEKFSDRKRKETKSETETQLDEIQPADQRHSKQDTINVSTVTKSPESIVVGDRIVWLDLAAWPHFGVVKWIGQLDGHCTHLFAGIEFDEPNPYSINNGNYRSRSIFISAKDRAGFVRLDHISLEKTYLVERNLDEKKEEAHQVGVSDKIEDGLVSSMEKKLMLDDEPKSRTALDNSQH